MPKGPKADGSDIKHKEITEITIRQQILQKVKSPNPALKALKRNLTKVSKKPRTSSTIHLIDLAPLSG